MKSERNSNIELIKFIAIILIVVSHILPFYAKDSISYIDLKNCTTNVNTLFLMFYRYMGQVGNVIFIIASSYFLSENGKVKIHKVLSIILDTFAISMFFLTVISFLNIQIPFKVLLKQFFPITYENNWFITCYLLFYIVHPFLNIIANNIDKEKLFKTTSFMVILYSFVQFIFKNKFFYTKLIGFIMIYFITVYIKRYKISFSRDIKKLVKINICSILLLIIFLIILNVIGIRVGFLNNKIIYFCELYNPIILSIGFSIFLLFTNLNLGHNKIINFLSSLTLLIYLIHDNYLFRMYINPKIFDMIYYNFSFRYLAIMTPIVSIIILGISIMLAIFYRYSIQKITSIISNKISKSCDKIIKNF